jgi:uncharacterized protein
MSGIFSLAHSNRWWNSGIVDSGFQYKTVRSEFSKIVEKIDDERALLIVGPRRVGKSTLMYQTISHLLASGVDPKSILFFSCDDPVLFDGKTTIGDILETYANDILHKNLFALDEKIYVFIDEIHTFKAWQTWIKSYYDKKCQIKFIVSGSSSAHLFDGASESLLGRHESIKVMPLSFIQFCEFWAAYREDEKICDFVNLLPSGSLFENAEDYLTKLQIKIYLLEEFKPYVNKVLEEYLLVGGYPEYFTVNNTTLWQKRIVEDIVGQGLYRDIVSLYRINSPIKLEKLLYFIAEQTGQATNSKTIGDTIGLDNETVSVYVDYLSKAYLAVSLDNYSPNIGKIIRKDKTLYVLDNGIANAVLRLRETSETRNGHLIEALCVRNALAICEDNYWGLYYWRDGNKEVDIVIDSISSLIPIEVKYRNNALHDIGGLNAFRDKFPARKVSTPLMITKNNFLVSESLNAVPFIFAK